MTRYIYILTLVLLVVCLVQCSEVGQKTDEKTGEWKSGQRTELVMATGGTGGTYYPLGGGIAKAWKDALPGVNVTVQATGASVANIRLLAKKEADIALVQNDIADYGRSGKEAFGEMSERYTNYLAMASLFPEVVQIVVNADSPIQTIQDLRGKKVVVGAAASGTELVSRQIFSAYGLQYKDQKDISPLFLGFVEGATAMKDGNAEGLAIVSGIPNAALVDVQTTKNIRLLPIDVEKLKSSYPFYVEFLAKAGTYKGMDKDVPVAALKALLVVRSDLDNNLVYMLTKTLFSSAQEIGHSKAREFDVKHAAEGVTIPFHPGAEKYLREQGVAIEPQP